MSASSWPLLSRVDLAHRMQKEETPTKPTIEHVSILQRVRLLCGQAKDTLLHSQPLQIGCGTVGAVILIVIVVAIVLCCMHKKSGLDNDMFYYSARDMY